MGEQLVCENCGSTKNVECIEYELGSDDDGNIVMGSMDLCSKCRRSDPPRCDVCGRWTKVGDYRVVETRPATPYNSGPDCELRCPRCYETWEKIQKQVPS